MLTEKHNELAILATKDLVIKMMERPEEYEIKGILDVSRAFTNTLHGVVAAMKNILIQP